MNKRKIFAIAFGILGVLVLSLAVSFIIARVIKKPAPLADLSLQGVISRCEAALDEFAPAGVRAPQRVCKVEGGAIMAFSSDADLNSEIKPGDKVVISVNLADILQRDWTNVSTGEAVEKPAAQTRLCFATYPVLMEENMPGYPNFDEGANDRFYESRAWSFYPISLFDPALGGDNFACSHLLPLSEFSPKVSFALRIPPEDLLALDQKAFRTGSYGVKIVSIPESFLPGITVESILANYQLLPPIYTLLNTIAR